jgi:hypothetical protein
MNVPLRDWRRQIPASPGQKAGERIQQRREGGVDGSPDAVHIAADRAHISSGPTGERGKEAAQVRAGGHGADAEATPKRSTIKRPGRPPSLPWAGNVHSSAAASFAVKCSRSSLARPTTSPLTARRADDLEVTRLKHDVGTGCGRFFRLKFVEVASDDR